MTFSEATWRAAVVTRWIARITGTLVTLFFLAFIVGEGPPPLWRLNLDQNLQFVGMCGVCAGLIAAWKCEGLGGVLTLVAYALLLIVDRHFNSTWLFGLPALTGLLHILCWSSLKAARVRSSWGLPPFALRVGGAMAGAFILLSANEIFLNPPLMTPTRLSADLVGSWVGDVAGGAHVHLQIVGSAGVYVQIGDLDFHATISNNRSWFGNLLNWREPYEIGGSGLNGGFSLRDGKLTGLIEKDQIPYRVSLQRQ